METLTPSPKTNISPENRPSQQEISSSIPSIFRFHVSFGDGNHQTKSSSLRKQKKLSVFSQVKLPCRIRAKDPLQTKDGFFDSVISLLESWPASLSGSFTTTELEHTPEKTFTNRLCFGIPFIVGDRGIVWGVS